MSKQIGNVEVSVNTYSDVLQHHGILGMKWGVRRYQNADGTLTAAGRKRYNIADPKPQEKKEPYDVYEDKEARKVIKDAYPDADDEIIDLVIMDQTSFLSKWLSARNIYVNERELQPVIGQDEEITWINASYNDGRLYTVYLRHIPGSPRGEWDVSMYDLGTEIFTEQELKHHSIIG